MRAHLKAQKQLTKRYPLPIRHFGLPKTAYGTNAWVFRRLITNILVSATLEENAIGSTVEIFKTYKNCRGLAGANHKVIKTILDQHRVRFSGVKAQRIVNAAKQIDEMYNGKVPSERKDLEKIKGIGRHCASTVLALAFDKPAFGVDLHVRRIAKRMGLVDANASDREIETVLSVDVDPAVLGHFSRAFVDFGKEICGASAECNDCFMSKTCPKIMEDGGVKPATVKVSAKPNKKAAPGVYTVVAGSSDRPYTVTVGTNHIARCNCKGFRFKRTCSHVKAELV